MPQPEVQDPIEEAASWEQTPDFGVPYRRDPTAIADMKQKFAKEMAQRSGGKNVSYPEYVKTARDVARIVGMSNWGPVDGSSDPDAEKISREFVSTYKGTKAKSEYENFMAQKKLSEARKLAIRQEYEDARTHQGFQRDYGITFRDKQDKTYTIEDAQEEFKKAPPGSSLVRVGSLNKPEFHIIPAGQTAGDIGLRDNNGKYKEGFTIIETSKGGAEPPPPDPSMMDRVKGFFGGNETPEQQPQAQPKLPLKANAQDAQLSPDGNNVIVTYTRADGVTRKVLVPRARYESM